MLPMWKKKRRLTKVITVYTGYVIMAFPVKYHKALLDEGGCENDTSDDNGNSGTI